MLDAERNWEELNKSIRADATGSRQLEERNIPCLYTMERRRGRKMRGDS